MTEGTARTGRTWMLARQVALLAGVGVLLAPAAVAGSLPAVGKAPPELDIRLLRPAADKCGASAAAASPSWEDLEGQVVILDFWATWCPPCIESIPHLNALVETFAGEPVRFFSISYETPEMVAPFLADHPMDTTVALDNDLATFKAFGAWGLPMAVLVNRDGVVAAVIHPEDLDEEVVREVLAGRFPDVKPAEPWHDPEGAEKYFRATLEGSRSIR